CWDLVGWGGRSALLNQPSPPPREYSLGQILEKVVLSHARSNSCRELRLFAGAKEFKPWLKHTTEMLQEWAVPDAKKRRCLIESLSGPALDVIRTLKLIDPEVSVKDCLEALNHTFGSVKGPKNSYCKFLNSRQQIGEKISAYIQRLKKLLQRAVMRGAVTAKQMNRTRLTQIVRGAQYQNSILLHLRLRERREHPPSYSQLIKEVKKKEKRQAASEFWEAQSLEPAGTTPLQMASVLMVSTTKELAQQVQVLTKRIAELQNTIDRAKTSRNKEPLTVVMEKSAFKATIPSGRRGKGQFFCYRCGQNGHSAAKCHNKKNPSLVYEKLRIKSQESLHGCAAEALGLPLECVPSASVNYIALDQSPLPMLNAADWQKAQLQNIDICNTLLAKRKGRSPAVVVPPNPKGKLLLKK
uniref:CCHC-type domain-containing protein n=1 Tax=Chrysemys picta bellii TaxID=8478 RepID=A0A8C3FBG7_CHRPI